ncbi:TPA: conserved hypothetical protein [Aquificae Joseph's Coat Spring virus]|nr:TPA: conserved hypothetical protein [Aquificae Joseph's Coat Spring virus]
MAVAYLGGPAVWEQQAMYSNNPFLNAIQDLMPLMNLFTNYMQYKPFIDQYSNTSLSDLAPIIKQYLPDVVSKDGKIDYKKLQTYLTDSKDPMKQQIASQVLDIARTRYQFANAPFQWQMQALNNPTLATILNGQQLLTKSINTMQNVKKLNDWIDKSNLPPSIKGFLHQYAPKFVNNPYTLSYLIHYLYPSQSTTQKTKSTPSILQPLNQPNTSILQPLTETAPNTKPKTTPKPKKQADPLELDTYQTLGA